MTMLRNSTLNQLKRINDEIKAQGGTTDRRSDSEKNFSNSMWTHDPVDAHKSGKRKIATYDELFSIDIPDAPVEVKMKKENMKHILSFDKMNENGPNDTPQEIMKNMKTIKNWFSQDTPKKEHTIGLIGKFIDNGNVKGYVNRIEGTKVFIETIDNNGIVEIKLKDAVKGYKPEKEKTEANIAIEGPNNKSVGTPPKGGGGYSPKIDAKGEKAPDQKITNKINKEKSIKKFSDMSIDFDSNKAKTTKKDVAPKIDKKGEETKDSKTNKKNYGLKDIKKFSDLSNPMKEGKPTKSENKPGASIDKKSEKAKDNKITKKNTKVKKFSDMNSNVQTGPNKKK